MLSEEGLDRGKEWRAFNMREEQELSRTGSPLTLRIHDRGLSTRMGNNSDYYSRSIKRKTRYKYRRLRRWNRRFKNADTRDRNLSKALRHIRRVGENLNLPKNVVETAARVYRKALDKDLIKGRTIEGIAMASVYAACRLCKVVRGLDSIAEESTLTTKQLARAYRHLYWNIKTEIPETDHNKCLSKIANKLGLYGGSGRIAKAIMEKANEEKLTVGRSPYSIASACIYIAAKIAGKYMTQRDVAKASNVTIVTIRNRYKELVKKLDITTKI